MQQSLEHQLIDHVVFCRQDSQRQSGRFTLGGWSLQATVGIFLANARQWHFHAEGRAAAKLTLDGQFSTHELYEFSADRKAKARAAKPAGGRSVHLREPDEQFGEPLRIDADAGVGNPEAQASLGVAGGHADLAVLGELQGVGDQIIQNLPHARGITVIDAPGGPDVEREGNPLLVGQGGEGGMGPLSEHAQVEIHGLQLELSGFYLC